MFSDIECVDFDVEFIYNVHFTITDMLTCSNKCLLSKGLNLHNHFVNLKINASNKVGSMTSINLLKLMELFLLSPGRCISFVCTNYAFSRMDA